MTRSAKTIDAVRQAILAGADGYNHPEATDARTLVGPVLNFTSWEDVLETLLRPVYQHAPADCVRPKHLQAYVLTETEEALFNAGTTEGSAFVVEMCAKLRRYRIPVDVHFSDGRVAMAWRRVREWS